MSDEARTVTVSYRERLVGPMARAVSTPHVGAMRGRAEASRLTLDLVVRIDDLAACAAAPDHPASVAGRAAGPVIGEATVAGSLRLYVADPEVGMKRTEYRLRCRAADGRSYRLEATTFVRPRRATRAERATAYVRLWSDDETPPRVLAAGLLRRRTWLMPAMLWSLRVSGESYLAGLTRLLTFVRNELRTPVATQAT